MRIRNRLTLLTAIAFSAIAAGCGGDQQAESAADGAFNDTDRAFIADMSAHHEGAIEMARIAQTEAEHPEIRELASEIVAAQDAEIAEMEDISRGLPDAEAPADGGMGMDDAEMGMEMDPAELKDAKPFDRAFIDAMIPHHEGAIAMAEEELSKGEHPKLREMAQGIITAQRAEIDQMTQWRQRWYGASANDEGAMTDHGSMDMGD